VPQEIKGSPRVCHHGQSKDCYDNLLLRAFTRSTVSLKRFHGCDTVIQPARNGHHAGRRKMEQRPDPHDHAGARRTRASPRLSAQRRGRYCPHTTPCFSQRAVRTGARHFPIIAPANEAGVGFHAAGTPATRALSVGGGLCLVTRARGATKHCYTGSDCSRFGADVVNLRAIARTRPSAPTRSRRRRCTSMHGS